jgi:hypothetical protein
MTLYEAAMMNDEIEQLLGRLTPRGVRPELRPQILAAVANQCRTSFPTRPGKLDESDNSSYGTLHSSPWLRWSAIAVAASLLVAIGANIWVNQASERRLAQFFSDPPVSKQAMEVANAVEKITDAKTAQWIYQQFAARQPSGNGLAAYAAYSNMLKQLIDRSSVLPEEPFNETSQKDPQMDRGNPGRTGGGRPGCQRRVRLDYRHTA